MRAKNLKKTASFSRGSAILAVSLVFLVLYLPVLFFRDQVIQLNQKESFAALTELKDQLLQEVSDFQSDLQPVHYIENAFKNSQEELIQVIGEEGNAWKNDENGEITLNSEIFNKYLVDEFKSKYGIELLFTASTDEKIRKRNLTTANFFVKSSMNNAELANLLLMCGLKTSAREKYFEAMGLSKTQSSESNKAFDKKADELHFGLTKIFSTFPSTLPSSGIVNVYFSDHYGFQKLFVFHNSLKKDGRFLGAFTAGAIESSMDIGQLVKQAVQGHGKDLKREIWKSDHQVKSDFWETGSRIYCAGSIPADFISLIQSQKGTNLAVIDAKLVVSAHTPTNKQLIVILQLIDKFGLLIFMLFFTSCVYSYLYGFSLPIRLRRKFLLIMGSILVPPALLISLFSFLTSQRMEAERFNLAKNKLLKKTHELELLYKESLARQTISSLWFKRLFSRLGGSPLTDHKLGKQLYENLGRTFLPGVFYDYKGHFLDCKKFGATSYKSIDQLVLNNCIRYLNNLRSLDKGEKAVRSQLQQAQLADGVLGDLFQIMSPSQVLANELQTNANMVKATLLAKATFLLLPDLTASPVKPSAIGFFPIPRSANFFSLVVSRPDFPHRLLHQIDEDSEIFLGMAVRDSYEIEDYRFLEHSRGWPDLRELFANAMKVKASGVKASEEKGITRIQAWVYDQSSEVVIVGMCLLSQNPSSRFFFLALPMAVVAFVLIALLILSEIMAGLFLGPVGTLERGATEIAATGDFSTTVAIESNDEFDFMGRAFNQMVSGLLQRSRLTRFVSDRLVKNIGRDSNKEASLISEKLQVTVLCSDLRDFTTISESNDPESVVEMLNQYFTEMEVAIKAGGGVIDRFIGDAIIAVFYPDSCENTPSSACEAAMLMRKSLQKLNHARAGEGKFKIENGIGIATGPVISGRIGRSGGRQEFTVTGKVVGLANELESCSKSAFVSRIVVDDETRRQTESLLKFEALSGRENCYQLLRKRT